MANHFVIYTIASHEHTLITYIVIYLSPLNTYTDSFSTQSKKMSLMGNDVYTPPIMAVEKFPELVEFGIEMLEGPEENNQVQTISDEEEESSGDVKVIIQELEKKMNKRFDAMTKLMSLKNDQVMKQIGLLVNKVDGLTLQVNPQVGSSGTMFELGTNVLPEVSPQNQGKGKEKMEIAPSLFYCDELLKIDECNQGMYDDPQSGVYKEKLIAESLCLFSEQNIKFDEGQNQRIDDPVARSPNLEGFQFVDTEELTHYY